MFSRGHSCMILESKAYVQQALLMDIALDILILDNIYNLESKVIQCSNGVWGYT